MIGMTSEKLNRRDFLIETSTGIILKSVIALKAGEADIAKLNVKLLNLNVSQVSTQFQSANGT